MVHYKLSFTSYAHVIQVTFIPESVEPLCYEIIEQVLKDKIYSDVLAQKWIDEICSRITKDLVDMNKPFKYLGTRISNHIRIAEEEFFNI